MRLSHTSGLIIAGYAGFILFARLGDYRVLTLHEILFAQPAKEMLASGNFLHATIGGVPSDHKPLLTHWTIAASMALFRSESAWVVRLPIALSSIASSLIVAALAARWLGDRIGLWAGLIQSSSLFFALQGRLAESDMLLCLFVTAALAAFATAVVPATATSPRISRHWPVLFYLAAGCAFLTKGPLGLVFIFGACGAYALATWRDWRRTMGFFLDPIGLLLFAFLLLSWPIAAAVTRPEILDAWRLHHLQRFTNGLDGRKDTFYYLHQTPFMMLPWFLVVPLGLWAWWRERQSGSAPSLFLAAWFGVGFFVLCCAAFKHKHYLIPILPPLAIVAAVGLERFRLFTWKPWIAWTGAGLLAAAGAIGAGVFQATPYPWANLVTLLFLVGGIGFGSALVLSGLQRPSGALGALFGTAALLIVGIQGFLQPYFDDYRDQTILALKAGEHAAPGAPLFVVDLGESQVLYYARSPAIRVESERLEPLVRASAGRTIHALAPLSSVPKLDALGAVEIMERCASLRPYQTEGDRIALVAIHLDKVGAQAANDPAEKLK